MLKYPRYHWRQDRRRKLTPFKTELIIFLGNTLLIPQKNLSKWFKVSQPAIHYILMGVEERKRLNQEKYKKNKSNYYKYTKEQRRAVRARKRKLQLRKVQDYYNVKTKIYREHKKENLK